MVRDEFVESRVVRDRRDAGAGPEERVAPGGRERHSQGARIGGGLEPIDEFEEVGGRLELVRGTNGDDQVGYAELGAKAGDVEPQGAQPRRRRTTVPDPVEETLDVDRCERRQGEQGKQGAPQRRARRVDHSAVIDHIDRSEQAYCWHRHPFRSIRMSTLPERRFTVVRDQSRGGSDLLGQSVGESGSVQQC